MVMSTDLHPSAVIDFWKESGPDRWFAHDDSFDAEFRRRFEATHFAAARRELDHWAESPFGSLALLLLLDQFPRNCFRHTGHAFATDPLARHFARLALDNGDDQRVETELRRFYYLPLQHSEDMTDQDRALNLFRALGGGPDTIKWAEHHHGVIARFGRFPHRNAALGRDTTPEEQTFLDRDGFAG